MKRSFVWTSNEIIHKLRSMIDHQCTPKFQKTKPKQNQNKQRKTEQYVSRKFRLNIKGGTAKYSN